MRTGSPSQRKSGVGVTLTTQPLLAPTLKTESYTSNHPLGLHGLLWGEVYIYQIQLRLTAFFFVYLVSQWDVRTEIDEVEVNLFVW
jgi:hypothetical protein